MRRTDDATALPGRCRQGGTAGPDAGGDRLFVPDYEGYCFANVPGTAGSVLGVDAGRPLPADVLAGVETGVSHVVVVVLDSFGWHRWRRDAADHRFLRRIDERGSLTPLTSVASASTAPAITSVHTGVPPADHGVLGCDVRLPDHDTVVRPFPHEVREDVADDAGSANVPPVTASEVVAADPVYPAFAAAGVETAVVQPAETLGTAYADATFRGATQVPYGGVADGAATLRERLAGARGHSYTYWYTPILDSVTHEYGPDSGAFHDALARVTRHLSRALYDDLDAGTAAETLLVVTADHGTVPLDPDSEDELRPLAVEGVASNLRRRRSGSDTRVDDRVPPFGDPRLCHLAVESGREEAVVAALEARGATALTRGEVVERGLFGPSDEHTGALERRCGDVVVHDADRPVVYPGMEKVASFAGIHGGLTPRELLVPFAAARLSRLQS